MTKNLSFILRGLIVVAIAINLWIYSYGLPGLGGKQADSALSSKEKATPAKNPVAATHVTTTVSASPSVDPEEYFKSKWDDEKKKLEEEHRKQEEARKKEVEEAQKKVDESVEEIKKQHEEEVRLLKEATEKAAKELEEEQQKNKEPEPTEEEIKQKEEEEKKKKEEEEERHRKEEEFKAPYWEKIRAWLAKEEDYINRTIVFPPESVEAKSNAPLQPAGKKIALLTAFDNGGSSENYKNVTKMSMDAREEYCQFHGYIHQFLNFTELKMADPSREKAHAVWLKMDAIKKTFDLHPSVEWVWWVDTDVIIMDPQRDLASHILNPHVLSQRLTYGKPLLDIYGQVNGLLYPEKSEVDIDDIDLVISQDLLGLNAGSFFIRRSQFIDWLLDFWFEPIFMNHQFPRAEQGCLIHLMNHHPILRKHIGLVPQRMINCYDEPEDDPGHSRWHPHNFVVHFAGKNTNDGFLNLWDRYWVQRRLLPEDARIASVESLNVPRPTEEEIEAEKLKQEEEEKAKQEEEEKKKQEEEEQKKKEEEKTETEQPKEDETKEETTDSNKDEDSKQ